MVTMIQIIQHKQEYFHKIFKYFEQNLYKSTCRGALHEK